MAEHMKPIGIGDDPALLRALEEVRTGHEPRILRHDGEDLAMVVPLSRRTKRRGRTLSKEDYEAFRSAAGSWADVDTDALIERIYEMRRRSTRPPVDL